MVYAHVPIISQAVWVTTWPLGKIQSISFTYKVLQDRAWLHEELLVSIYFSHLVTSARVCFMSFYGIRTLGLLAFYEALIIYIRYFSFPLKLPAFHQKDITAYIYKKVFKPR